MKVALYLSALYPKNLEAQSYLEKNIIQIPIRGILQNTWLVLLKTFKQKKQARKTVTAN